MPTDQTVELWQSLVDSFAAIGDGVHRNWIVERGQYPDLPENDAVNSLLSALSAAQRQTLADMLIDARGGGVFDALVVLHDRLALHDATYEEKGIEMKFEPHGYTLYQDFVRRKAGDPWPVARDV
jgi:hypothetical protein